MTQGTEAASVVTPIRAAAEALHATIQVARALVEGGRRIDLGGLDAQAAALCAAVMLLPPGSAQPLRPTLESLAREVDGLTAALLTL